MSDTEKKDENENNKPMTFGQFKAFVICGAIMFALFYSSSGEMDDSLFGRIFENTLGRIFGPIFSPIADFSFNLFPDSCWWLSIPTTLILCGGLVLGLLWLVANFISLFAEARKKDIAAHQESTETRQ